MEIYLGIDGFDDSVSSKKLYKYYQNNENIIKDIGELNFGLFPFQNILSKFLNKVRIKYFLGCNIVSFTYSTLIKSKTTEPPIKGVVSKFFVNLPMKDEVLINFSKNGVDFSYWLNEIRNQLIQLFIEHNQPTDLLEQCYNEITEDNFYYLNKIGEQQKNKIHKTSIQIYLKNALKNDTYFIVVKRNKVMNNIELFTFDNNYGKNFIDSNYIIREGKWIDDDTFIATNKSLHICFIYRCSNNRLTIAFSPFNKNNYNKFKYKFLQNHIGSITEVVIDTHLNEVESS